MCSIGNKIKYYREQQNLSQKELANKACISFINLKDIESGVYIPDVDMLNSLASVLGVHSHLLLDDYEDDICNLDYLSEDLCIILREKKASDYIKRLSIIEQRKGFNVFCVTGLKNITETNWYINTVYGHTRYSWEVNGNVHYGISFKDAVLEFSDTLEMSNGKPWVFIVEGSSAMCVEGIDLLVSMFAEGKAKVVFIVSKENSVINVKNIFTRKCKHRKVAAYKDYDPVFSEAIIGLVRDLMDKDRDFKVIKDKDEFVRGLLAEPEVHTAINGVIKTAIKNKMKVI